MNDKILELIKRQLTLVIRGNEDYKDLKLHIADEQQFAKLRDRDPNAIYVVVKFLSGSLLYDISIVPTIINVVAGTNKLLICKSLLLEYTKQYNLMLDSTGKIRQTYTSPQVVSNFNEVYDGLCSLLSIAGTFQVGDHTQDFKIIDSVTKEPVLTLTQTMDCSTQNDSQPFTDDDFTKSVSKFATRSLSLTMYLTDNALCNKAVQYFCGLYDINTPIYFDIVFDGGSQILNLPFKFVNVTFNRNANDFPEIAMSFTN